MSFFFVPANFNTGINVAAAAEKGLNEVSCVGFTELNPAACAAWAANGMLTVSGYFTWLGGVSLNHAVDMTILKMGQVVNSTEAIETAWVVLRDLANIGLIFGLLAIGIATILQVSGYGMRELLAKLIVVALLINFSFFITKAIVDVGNGIAVVAYQQLSSQTSGCQGGGSCISDKFMQALKLPTLYNTQGAYESSAAQLSSGARADLMDWSKILLAGVFGSVFLIVAGFVFLAGALLLVLRFVILVLLMILSPVAWMASILPATRSASKQWWNTLWKEVFFAPAYLILLLVTLKIVQDNALAQAVNLGDASFSAAMLAGDTSSAVLFIYYAIIIGFMTAALLIARKIGAHGSGTITGFGQKWAKNIGSGAWKYARQGAGAATFGTVGALGRNTIGRKAHQLADSRKVLNLSKEKGIKGWYGRTQLRALRGTAGASFDARNAPGIKQASASMGLGKAGGKGGYEEKLKTQIAAEKKFAGSLGKDQESIDKVDQLLAEDQAKLARVQSIINSNQSARAVSGATAMKATIEARMTESRASKGRLEKGRALEYAENLEKRGKPAPFGIFGFRVRSENKQAADAIRKDLNKGKSEKEQEALIEAIKSIKVSNDNTTGAA